MVCIYGTCLFIGAFDGFYIIEVEKRAAHVVCKYGSCLFTGTYILIVHHRRDCIFVLSLFQKKNRYVDCDTWIGKRNDYPFQFPANSTWEWYFAANTYPVIHLTIFT